MNKLSKRTKRILLYICGAMILFGVLLLGFIFTNWGWQLDNLVSRYLDLPNGFSIAALKAYWIVVVILLLVGLYYPEK